jgi:hypothetical protein
MCKGQIKGMQTIMQGTEAGLSVILGKMISIRNIASLLPTICVIYIVPYLLVMAHASVRLPEPLDLPYLTY